MAKKSKKSRLARLALLRSKLLMLPTKSHGKLFLAVDKALKKEARR